jgi:hypothetical protein
MYVTELKNLFQLSLDWIAVGTQQACVFLIWADDFVKQGMVDKTEPLIITNQIKSNITI